MDGKEHELFEIHQYFEQLQLRGKRRPIVGNDNVRLLTTILFPLRGTSILLRGEAGSAKSSIIRGAIVLAFGPGVLDDAVPEVLLWGGSSDKALLTDNNVNRIELEATHCIIPELEFVLTTDRGYDIVKVWTEGEVYPYERATNFGHGTERLVLKPLPILTSIANESPRLKDLGEEMERRYMPLYTESNREMTQRIHIRKAEIEAYPDDSIFIEAAQQVSDLRGHFKNCMKMNFGGAIRRSLLDSGEKILIKNPSAVYLHGVVPKRFTISNTYIDYWHEIVKAITTFYYTSRPIYERRTDKVLMATPVDNYLAWLIGGQAIVDASLRLRDLGHVLMQIVPTISYSYGGDLSISNEAKALDHIVDEVSTKGYERSRSQIKELLLRLVMANYVKMDDKDRFWKTMQYGDEFVKGINWQECVDETKKVIREKYPEVAQDFIPMYCDDPVCLDPFTGKKVRLLDIEAGEESKTETVVKTKKRVTLDDLA